MKVSELTGRRSYKERRFGVEIEVEHCREWPQGWWWQITEDGSLRNNGMEFLSPPATLAQIHDGIDRFYAEGFDVYGWKSSKRTGIHLHMDTSTLTMDELGAFLTAYAALEPVLFNVLCGPDREENIYCVPWYRAKEQALYVQGLMRDYKAGGREVLLNACAQACKYNALYIEPLRRYGTVEFRGAPTFDSAAELHRLVTTFDTLLDRTQKDGTAAAVMARFENINDATRYYIPDVEVPDADLMVLRADSLGIADLFVPDVPVPKPPMEDDGAEWRFPAKPRMSRSAYRALVGRRGGPQRGEIDRIIEREQLYRMRARRGGLVAEAIQVQRADFDVHVDGN